MVPLEHAPPRACDLDAQQQLRDQKETPDAAAAKSGEDVICFALERAKLRLRLRLRLDAENSTGQFFGPFAIDERRTIREV